MRDRFRQSMVWLHTWTGLIVGWVLYFIFVTGTSGYFHNQITRWMKPELPRSQERKIVSPEKGFPALQRFLEKEAPGADHWSMDLPQEGNDYQSPEVWWELPFDQNEPGKSRFGDAAIDAETGGRLKEKARDTGGGGLLYRMHYNLHYLPETWGWYVVGFCSMVMLVALITGVIAHRKIFRDFFKFRPGDGPTPWLDAHAVIGVAALPFFIMITYSGLLFFSFNYLPVGINVFFKGDIDNLYAAMHGEEEHVTVRSGSNLPLPPLLDFVAKAKSVWPESVVAGIRVDFPGDSNAVVNLFRHKKPSPDSEEMISFRVDSGELIRKTDNKEAEEHHSIAHDTEHVLSDLHRGHFAGPVLRWLYFGSGLLGCGMIATGLVYWTIKRRPKSDGSQIPSFGHQLVERLNIGTIAGLPAGVAVYFWANRLVPVEWANRREWEINALFIAWALLLLYPAFRPLMKAWREQLALTAALFGLLPLLNVLTTDRHLGRTLPAGDWELAGMDLTLLALGVLFAWTARKVWKTSPSQISANQNE